MITSEEMLSIAENSKEVKVMAQIGLSLVREFGDEVNEAGDMLAKGLAGLSGKLYKEYLNQGFTEEQAFTLLLNSQYSLQKAISDRNSKPTQTKAIKEKAQ